MITRRLESSKLDEYGNEIPDEELETTKCLLEPRRRHEEGAYGEVGSDRYFLFLPPGTQVTTADVIEIDGKLFQLYGEPNPIWHPRRRRYSHVEATVVRTAGGEDVS